MRTSYLPSRKQYLTTIGVDPTIDDELIMTALTHKSYAMDFVEEMSHHERLEFLGDAVLGSSIATMLYHHFSDETEATLSLYKIALVREETLALVAKSIKLDQHILISKGEEGSGGRNKPAIISDCLEALIGMIAVHSGYDAAYAFVQEHVFHLVDDIHSILPIKSAKSRVQEYVQGLHKQLPIYEDTIAQTDDHENPILFTSTLIVDGHIVATGTGTNKKKAQAAAAEAYLDKIDGGSRTFQ